MQKSDAQSLQNFGAPNLKALNNTTVDSGQPTASGGCTKASKHDMSGSATDINQNNVSKLSHSDLGARKPIIGRAIPKTYVQLKDDRRIDSARSQGHLMANTSPLIGALGLNKMFEVTVHSVKMQISSRIDL